MFNMNFTVLLLLCFFGTIYGKDKHGDDSYMHPKLPFTGDRSPFYNYAQDNATFWNIRAQKTLRHLLEKTKNENIAKNVILFLGDGMSIPTIAASRVYMGGEESELSFDKFPFTGLSKTYCVDKQVPDSACTSTAYLTGIKGNYHTIGVTSAVTLDDCLAMNNTALHSHSIAAWSQAENKRTGFVTTARVTHASPAGVYAHTAERTWESDTDVRQSKQDPNICHDIAYQLINSQTGKNLHVILGGGRGNFLPKETTDEEGDIGFRSDGQNLIDQWLNEKENEGKEAKYIWNRRELININGNVDYLFGMFDASHVPYNLDRDAELDPSLEEMVDAAIKILRKGNNGYFLFVEGGRIDTAHHEVKARKAIDEVAEFSKAIQRAVDMTSERDTLIVVTSDHAHSMAFSGYPDRGRDVLGLSGMKDRDNMDYLTLAYANGPGYRAPNPDGSRVNVATLPYTDKDFQYPGMYPLASETHGGDDVAIYARGPWSHLFNGVMEENVIPHVMAYASCVGEGLTACGEGTSTTFGHQTNVDAAQRPSRPRGPTRQPPATRPQSQWPQQAGGTQNQRPQPQSQWPQRPGGGYPSQGDGRYPSSRPSAYDAGFDDGYYSVEDYTGRPTNHFTHTDAYHNNEKGGRRPGYPYVFA